MASAGQQLPAIDATAERAVYASAAAAALLALHWFAGYSYPLFHSLVEFARIAVSVGIFTLAWNSRRWSGNGYLTLIGVSQLYIALMNLAHALAYKGIAAFPGYDADLPTQLWIAMRGIEAVSFCIAPLYLRRTINASTTALAFAAVTGLALWAIFGGRFPDCYVEGQGLTPFKVASELVIMLIFAAALVLLRREARAFEPEVFRLLMLSIPLTITAELAFTRYASVFGAANEAGHLLMLAATLLIYRAILVTGIVQPFALLFREARLREDELEGRVQERTARLAESEAKFQGLFDSSADAMFIVDAADRIIEANRTACERLGYAREAFVGLPLAEIRGEPDGDVQAQYERVRAAGQAVFETTHRTSDGRLIPVEINARVFSYGGAPAVLSAARDITERRRAIAKIRESSELLERMFSTVHVLIAYLDRNLNFVRVNQAYAQADGVTSDYFPGKNHFALYPDPELEAVFRRVLQTGEPYSRLDHPFRYPHHPERGVTYWDFRVEPVRDAAGAVSGLVLSLLDVTERRRASDALRDLNRALRMLSRCNGALVHATEENALVVEMCRIIAEVGRYRRVWIGLVRSKGDRSVQPVVCADCAPGDLESGTLALQDAAVVREVLESRQARTVGTPASADAPDAGEASTTVLPLLFGEDLLGVLSLRYPSRAPLGGDEARLLDELAGDLAFGIATLRTRSERDRIMFEHAHHQEILRSSLEQSLAAIAATVEKRDAYTAGHEARVADLAVAIAAELGMDPDRIHGLRLAASVHDLGKIQVPAEILSKPGRLNPIELSLIRLHPQVGHEILKDVRFPWPIADIILQHHEAADGSGYPQGLKGAQILPEALVLTVADVVEAMSSHRPYRPALGIEAALAEIRAHRGTRYDAAAVDACMRLFAEKRFAFEPQER